MAGGVSTTVSGRHGTGADTGKSQGAPATSSQHQLSGRSRTPNRLVATLSTHTLSRQPFDGGCHTASAGAFVSRACSCAAASAGGRVAAVVAGRGGGGAGILPSPSMAASATAQNSSNDNTLSLFVSNLAHTHEHGGFPQQVMIVVPSGQSQEPRATKTSASEHSGRAHVNRCSRAKRVDNTAPVEAV